MTFDDGWLQMALINECIEGRALLDGSGEMIPLGKESEEVDEEQE